MAKDITGTLTLKGHLVLNPDQSTSYDFRYLSKTDTHFLFADSFQESFNIGGSVANNGSIARFAVTSAGGIELKQDTFITGDVSASGGVSALGGITFGDSTLSDYEEGTFVAGYTGLTTVVSATARYTRIGDVVNLWIQGGKSGTSNSSSFGVSGLPFAIRPGSGTNHNFLFGGAYDNGLPVEQVTKIRLSSAFGDLIKFFIWNGSTYDASGWTTSGTKGVATRDDIIITYNLKGF